MDFKSMLQQLSQLSEGTKETEKGRVHKAEPGGYGRKFDTDEEGDEDKKDNKKEPAAKRGRGRPKKGADSETGQVAKYDNAKGLQDYIVGNKPKGKELDKLPKKKHTLKDWVEQVEAKYVAEGQQLDELRPQTLRSYAGKARGEANWARGVASHPSVQGHGEFEPMAGMKWAKGAKPVPGSEADKYEKHAQKRFDGANKADAKLGVDPKNFTPSQSYDYTTKGGWGDKKNPAVKETSPGQQLTVKPMPGAAQLVDPASNKVMATGDAASVKNIQGAVAQGKVQMRGEEMAESDDDYSAKKARAGKDIGKPGKQFGKIAASAGKKYGSKAAGERVAGAVLSKLRQKTNEADIPSDQSDMGAGLGAGRNAKTLESKAKPDFLDLDKDKNKKEPMSAAAKDAEKKKKKLKENAHRHSSAKLLGKAHALARESYNCKYDDLDEVRMYHEGYKEGLDECYGQGVYEAAPSMPPATTGGMTSQAEPAMEDALTEGTTEKRTASQWLADPKLDTQVIELQVDGVNITNTSKGLRGFTDGGKGYPYASEPYTSAKNPMYFKDFLKHVMSKLGDVKVLGVLQAGPGMAVGEGNAFTKALAQTPDDGEFSVGGKTFTDRSNYNAKIDEFAFESLDNQLNALLNEDSVSEGMSVSISKGNQGSPDSVSVTAQDAEADQLLAMIKQSGLGLFGQEGAGDFGVPQDGSGAEKHGEINVVGDHDGMMSLIKKVTGASSDSEEGGSDYEDEEGHEGHDEHDHEGHEHTDEETCNECGYMESKCQCDEEAVMGEEESYAQEEEQVAEDNPPDSDAAETTADEDAEAQEDQALATADEEQVTEWANDAGQSAEEFDEETFTTNERFINKTLAGGLNKPKSTGQTTIPVVASQMDRQMAYESILHIRRLAGIK